MVLHRNVWAWVIAAAGTVLLFVSCVRSKPLDYDHRTSINGTLRYRDANDTDNHSVADARFPTFGDAIDFRLACRSCEQLVSGGVYAMFVEKPMITAFFTADCAKFFKGVDKRDCEIAVDTKVDKVYQMILGCLDPTYLCQTILHICPAPSTSDPSDLVDRYKDLIKKHTRLA